MSFLRLNCPSSVSSDLDPDSSIPSICFFLSVLLTLRASPTAEVLQLVVLPLSSWCGSSLLPQLVASSLLRVLSVRPPLTRVVTASRRFSSLSLCGNSPNLLQALPPTQQSPYSNPAS